MEIEIRAVLTESKYNELRKILPEKFEKINEDVITTVKFKPDDVRVRYSEKLNEVVFKDDDATAVSRKEVSINLRSSEDSANMIHVLKELGLAQAPSWITKKEEFVCKRNGAEYTLSLQHIENFAYILEAEAIADDGKAHIPILKEILSSLGCEPVNADEFKKQIADYAKRNSK